MSLSCGINVNLNNLSGELTTTVSSFFNLKGLIGKPGGPAILASTLPTGLAGLKGKVSTMVPAIPLSAGVTSLRAELNTLSGLTFGSTAALSKAASIARDFAGATGLSGMVNLNLTDLTQSVFSLSGSFDPCALTVPNIVKDASGSLESLVAQKANIGGTSIASKLPLSDQSLIDNLKLAITNNIPITDSLDVNAVSNALEKNVSTVITGMGNSLRKLPSGEQILETESMFISRLKTESLPLMMEV
jgi:hypothetical protein